jgi:hypothetical protein
MLRKWLVLALGIVVLFGWAVWHNEHKASRYAANMAIASTYIVQQVYVSFSFQVSDALNDESSFRAARESKDALDAVFKMQSLLSLHLNPDKTKAGLEEESLTGKLVSPVELGAGLRYPSGEWDRTSGDTDYVTVANLSSDLVNSMRTSFATPLDQLTFDKWMSYYAGEGARHEYHIANLLKSLDDPEFEKHPDHGFVHTRFDEIRRAYQNTTVTFDRISKVLAKRTDAQSWHPLLKKIIQYSGTVPFPANLPDPGLPLGLDKWTAWDISDTSNPGGRSIKCLNGILPWRQQADDPSGTIGFIVVCRRSQELVGRYVREGSSAPINPYPTGDGAVVETAYVLVGRTNPFRILASKVIRAEDPPSEILVPSSGLAGHTSDVNEDVLRAFAAEWIGTDAHSSQR